MMEKQRNVSATQALYINVVVGTFRCSRKGSVQQIIIHIFDLAKV